LSPRIAEAQREDSGAGHSAPTRAVRLDDQGLTPAEAQEAIRRFQGRRRNPFSARGREYSRLADAI
jgi:hypothetical protein